jgi:predicted component of type VI protein secretion system
MEMVIHARSNQDEGVQQPLVGRFDERGGTIGRSETNTLTLPDPKRHISRLQAQVAFRDGAYLLRNVGSGNALLVGGRPVNAGEGVVLKHGDELLIGTYVLRVALIGPGDTTQANAHQVVEPQSVIKSSLREAKTDPRRRAAAPFPAPPVSQGLPAAPNAPATAVADLLGGAADERPPDPFAGLFTGAPAAPPAVARGQPAVQAPAASGGDIDPFADLSGIRSLDSNQSAGAPEGAAPASGLNLLDLLGPGASATPAALDRAFGLEAAAAAGVDPLAAFLAAPPPGSPAERPPSNDPLKHFDALPAAEPDSTAPAAFDHTPQLQAAYVPPAVQPPRSIRPPEASDASQGGLRSNRVAPAGEPPTEPGALWAAFCEGARLGSGQPLPVDAALMRLLGQLLYESIDGALKLMAARAAVKQELRAEVTIIQPRNNNPLKFSPEAAAAIEQLLRPPLRGFMPGPLAVRDAMADLLGHAIGTMAGMRAALQGVLQRFEPAQLEAKLGSHNMMDAVLPMNRRAKLWEMYLMHFAGIRAEAHDDFHELFGKAFVQAYEEQLAQLKSNAVQ